MNLTKFTLSTLSSAMFAVGFAPTAFAQDDAETDVSGYLEEVIVSARFREESSQQTPLAITAVSGEDLVINGGFDITALAKSAPNMLLESGGTFTL